MTDAKSTGPIGIPRLRMQAIGREQLSLLVAQAPCNTSSRIHTLSRFSGFHISYSRSQHAPHIGMAFVSAMNHIPVPLPYIVVNPLSEN